MTRAEKLARAKAAIAAIRAAAPALQMVAPPAPEAPAHYAMCVGGKVYGITSLAEASRMFAAARDAHGEGRSRTPIPVILRNGEPWGHVSYNGRVWSCLPGEIMADDAPIYDPLM